MRSDLIGSVLNRETRGGIVTPWEDKNQFVNDWVDTLIFWAQCSPCISSIGALNAYSAVMAGNQNNALMAGDGLVWSGLVCQGDDEG